MSNIKTIEFIKKANLVHENKYDYSLVNYTRAIDKIDIICSIHGIFSQRSSAHLSGQGCPKCAIDRNTSSKADFISSAIKIHGNKYDYSLVNYKTSRCNVDVICKIHGVFSQQANRHLNGQGCPKCANLNRSKLNSWSTSDFITSANKVHDNKYDYSLVDYAASKDKIKILCPTHGEFEQRPNNHLSGQGCPKCNIGYNKSKSELEIFEFVKSIDAETKSGDRSLIYPLELDIVSDKYKLAIEFNGLYWHSSGAIEDDAKLSKIHVHKTDVVERMGYSLFHIFENEWNTKPDIIKSMISTKMGISNKIPARKCKIVKVSTETATAFFDKNHLQGGVRSISICYGLEYNNTIVAIMAFGKSRYTTTDWELLRFATILNTTVVGGASKLITHFRKNINGSIVSYANRRWSIGNVYKKLGFVESNISTPCYWYIIGNDLYHRSSFMKHKLKDKLKTFDVSLSERENMYNNGYRRIWDCGNRVFILGDLK